MSLPFYLKLSFSRRPALGAACLLILTVLPTLSAAQAGRTEAQVAQAARRFLTAQAQREGLSNPNFDITVVSTGGALHACAHPLTIAPTDAQRRNRMKFIATCPDTDAWRESFVVRVEASAEILVAAANIPTGRVLTDGDLLLERRDIANLPDALSDPGVLVGQAARRPLRVGQVLTRQLVVAPVLVRRGEPVRILVRTGLVQVDAAGEALEAGQRDDVIRVRNSSTGKVIRVRVIEQGIVEPAGIPAPSQPPD